MSPGQHKSIYGEIKAIYRTIQIEHDVNVALLSKEKYDAQYQPAHTDIMDMFSGVSKFTFQAYKYGLNVTEPGKSNRGPDQGPCDLNTRSDGRGLDLSYVSDPPRPEHPCYAAYQC